MIPFDLVGGCRDPIDCVPIDRDPINRGVTLNTAVVVSLLPLDNSNASITASRVTKAF